MKYFSDAIAVVGAASITWGVWLVSEPIAFMVAGVFMLAGAALIAYTTRKA